MKNWTTEQVQNHWAKKPKHIFKEPTRYILFSGGLGRPASTIKRAVEMAEWNATLFLNNSEGFEGKDFEGKVYELVKGSRPRSRKLVRRYRASVIDGEVKLTPMESEDIWWMPSFH